MLLLFYIIIAYLCFFLGLWRNNGIAQKKRYVNIYIVTVSINFFLFPMLEPYENSTLLHTCDCVWNRVITCEMYQARTGNKQRYFSAEKVHVVLKTWKFRIFQFSGRREPSQWWKALLKVPMKRKLSLSYLKEVLKWQSNILCSFSFSCFVFEILQFVWYAN